MARLSTKYVQPEAGTEYLQSQKTAVGCLVSDAPHETK